MEPSPPTQASQFSRVWPSTMLPGSSSMSSESVGSSEIVQISESVYQLYKPSAAASVQVVFFHGLQSGSGYAEAHLTTWKCEDGSYIWPQTWLVDEIPQAHVFSVSCNGVLRNSSNENIDMYILGENLISDLLHANIGQVPNCPVVLVGHSIGGLVIKELCCQAHGQLHRSRGFERAKLENFFTNLRGVFYYATPHHGSSVADRLADHLGGSLLKYFKALSTDTERLNSTFDGIRNVYERWLFAGLGEGCATNLGWFRDVMVVPEASARGDNFNVVEGADHFSVCRPRSKTSRSFSKLNDFLAHIAKETKKDARPENFQHLPKHTTGIDRQVEQVKAQLEDNTTLGLLGMGGSGKTTLARAIFNELCLTFEYTCFVPDTKHILGTVDAVKEQVWSYMHYKGRKVGKGDSSCLRGKQLLLFLDDISGERDLNVLLEMANESSLKSRFIVTSRERDLLNRLDKVHDVQLLNESNAQNLFMSHAFSHQAAPPPELAGLIRAIVMKCEGLPLTLEVLGQYLKTIKDVEDWQQVLNALDKAETVSGLDERLWQKLMPSYNGLKEKEKQIFLDSATIFNGDCKFTWYRTWTLREAKAAWREAYGVSERLMWKTLVDRSLVYNVKEDEDIRMHEQLRSLGRKVAKEALNSGPYRVWEETEALRQLQITDERDTENKEIHALQLNFSDFYKAIHLARPALKKLRKVRFLEVDHPVIIEGSTEDEPFPNEVVLLKCVGTSLFSPAHQSRLVVLHLSIYHEKFLPDSIGQLSALRFFILHAPHLDTLPDEIGQLSQLEHMKFSHCFCLHNLPETFGRLFNLKDLRFDCCRLLSALPESFGNLSTLSYLSFDYCLGLQSLPESFGLLYALKHLKFGSCESLHALPKSFGHLSALCHLEFLFCSKLRSLPESFGLLSSLVKLTFRNCASLETLPESFGKLSSLDKITLESCPRLERLPESFGQLSTLAHLELIVCDDLDCLPASFTHLRNLQSFKILVNLERMEGRVSDSMTELLVDKSVRYLIHCATTLEMIPDYFKDLRSLHTLQLEIVENPPHSFSGWTFLFDSRRHYTVVKEVGSGMLPGACSCDRFTRFQPSLDNSFLWSAYRGPLLRSVLFSECPVHPLRPRHPVDSH